VSRSSVYCRLFCLVLFFVTALGAQGQYTALVWSDEFDYTGLPDPARWGYDEGGHGWGNNELQYYTRNRTQNARVENGVLIIEALKEAYSGRDYTSARLVSRGKGDWLYGRIEVKAKLPKGRGTWSAIWMLPTDWAYGNWPSSGEIDIMEHVGYDIQKIYGTAHTEAYNHKLGTQKGGSFTGNDWETGFHVYAVEWDETTINFLVDNQKYYTFVNEGSWEKWPFDKRFHLILNLAIGGSWGAVQGVDDNIFPTRMEVDYVRVYQSADLKITGPAYLEPAEAGTFKCTQINGAAYDWKVPADAEILSGQGTPELTVRWGHSEGEVSVAATIGNTVVHAANYIKIAVKPQENTYWFGNLVDGIVSDLESKCSDGSTFAFTESGESLRIVYQTVSPASWPRFELTLPRPVNLKEHPYCVVNLKTYNKSNSVTLRFDFADIYGMETNSTPVFRPTPIIADGRFHTYQNLFTGHWSSSSPTAGKVDSTRIVKMIAYVNAGFFGISNKTDSLWIESIKFMKSPLSGIDQLTQPEPSISLWPNPVTDRMTLQSDQSMESIEIIDFRGASIQKIPANGLTTLQLSTSTLPPGLYLVRCTLDGGGNLVGRFLKH
jgi:beta-glucanase (GH16 family)